MDVWLLEEAAGRTVCESSPRAAAAALETFTGRLELSVGLRLWLADCFPPPPCPFAGFAAGAVHTGRGGANPGRRARGGDMAAVAGEMAATAAAAATWISPPAAVAAEKAAGSSASAMAAPDGGGATAGRVAGGRTGGNKNEVAVGRSRAAAGFGPDASRDVYLHREVLYFTSRGGRGPIFFYLWTVCWSSVFCPRRFKS